VASIFSNFCIPSRRIIILLHVVHWFPRWQHRCCRASREHFSNYLLWFILSTFIYIVSQKSDTPNSIDSFVNSQQIWKFLFTSKISGKFAIHCYLRSHQLNKKSGLMLMRRARAYSSSCSRVILVYLYPFRRNSLFCSQKSPKITKNQYCQVQGHLRLSMLTFLRSSSLVLVMISSMSVHICNYFHARQANNG